MKITKTTITVKELCSGFHDDGDKGVFSYNDRLICRPCYQREYCYTQDKRDAVIDTVRKGFPLNIMYWNRRSDDTFEILDGQQRTLSIAQYVTGGFSIKIDGMDKFYHNLSDEEREQIDNYVLDIYICEGSESEKLEWFKIINIAGETLTDQELLNATYAGPWLSDAKNYLSKRNCVAKQFADGFIKGNPIRQDYLEKALKWIADRDGLESGAKYMAIHQHDEDANDLWIYFQEVIGWAKRMFPSMEKKLTECQEWGILYNKYGNKRFNTNELRKTIDDLLSDEDVTRQAGIIQYVLSERTTRDEKYLSIRTFPEQMKRRVYTNQTKEAQANNKSNCPLCAKQGGTKIYDFADMQGDHVMPWSQGGKTVESNLRMLCKRCNNDKADKLFTF
jgi:hypothetical protein